MNDGFLFRPMYRRARAGIALIVVLITLVLLVGLVVAILTRVTASRAVSSAYANGADCRVLADTAINTVIGQIHDATSDSTQTISWASQPGAIRTYQGANFLQGYKLFSSSAMTDKTEATFAAGVDANWQSKVGQYVNLNQPVTKTVNTGGTPATKAIQVYPIADPALLGADPTLPTSAQGFSVTSDAPANLAMPVEWLYMREDGTLAAGQWQPDGTIKFTDGSTSPIHARIAFWTDDETAKVNVNTASEGLYWDTPHVDTRMPGDPSGLPGYGSYQSDPNINATPTYSNGVDNEGTLSFAANGTDQGLAFNPPAANEFNRFPGHPAMTSLSAVFPFLTPKEIFDIVPRVALGGSSMGTASVVASSNTLPLTLDSDRLYDSETEIALKTDNSGAGAPGRIPNSGFADGLTPALVNQRKFCLTASSRAPELNLFGRPRVAMWPVSSYNDSNHRTPYDQLIAFCTTLSTGIPNDTSDPTTSSTKWPFVFFRQNAYSMTDDANIASNKNLYSYLQDVTSKNSPGFGGSLQTKYGSNCDQILTEMLDYIRCTNSFDTSLEPNASSYNGGQTSGGEFTNGITSVSFFGTGQPPIVGLPGHGQVLPLHIGATSGLGRTPTVSEVALHFICTADGSQKAGSGSNVANNITLPLDPNPANAGKHLTLTSNQRQVQVMLEIELATPMEGYPDLNPCLQVQVTGASGFAVNGSILFPRVDNPSANNSLYTYNNVAAGGLGRCNLYGAYLWKGIGASGHIGFFPFVQLAKFPGSSQMPADNTKTVPVPMSANTQSPVQVQLYDHPFISDGFTVPADKLMTLKGATLTIKLFYPADGFTSHVSASAQPYQTLMVVFPDSANIPVPTQDTGDTSSWCFNQDGYTGTGGGATGTGGRLYCTRPPGDYIGNLNQVLDFVKTQDVIRSVQVADGDFRLNATMPIVPPSRFAQTGRTNPPALAHSLSAPFNNEAFASSIDYQAYMDKQPNRQVGSYGFGTSIPSVPANIAPDVPNTTDYVGLRKPQDTGDWDTGMGNQADGPFANMPDAGQLITLRGGQANYPPYFWYPDQDTGPLAKAFSPNRQVPSSGMFGSLPAGGTTEPWRTLLFRPQAGHPSTNSSPPDHLFMDLFWMPVVQPYAISEPFSTAGKINMNYQILPFTYIKRQTALYALLKAERMLAIPNSLSMYYKAGGLNQSTSRPWRHRIDIPNTLAQFDDKFASNQIFRSASQICELQLVPGGQPAPNSPGDSDSGGSAANMPSYWQNHALTGDNVKERPYANIYPRLTTQSNTFRVHYWVQDLKQANKNPARFIDPDSTYAGPKDAVTGQLRGSCLIERFLNSNDPRFTNHVGDGVTKFNPTTDSLNPAYRMRVLNSIVFNP